jgi:hypothetical protein
MNMAKDGTMTTKDAVFVFTVYIKTPPDTDNRNFLEDQANNLASEIAEWAGVVSVDWKEEN